MEQKLGFFMKALEKKCAGLIEGFVKQMDKKYKEMNY